MSHPDRHERVMELFLRARSLDDDGRSAMIQDECACDDGLQAEVRSLLEHDESPEPFLRTPKPHRGAIMGVVHADWRPDAIGPYRVSRRIGEGGMGIVFEAVQDDPPRAVAVKVLRPGWVSMDALLRFEREAFALARLEHPCIARLYHTGESREGSLRLPYITMELIRGLPVSEHAERHAWSIEQRLEVMIDVCDAVEYAHKRGIIHRDLKPANILVDETGRPRILDFGVARLADAPDAEQTLTGCIVGTPPYLSPEQSAGDPRAVDARSDVYSLGVLLYELLSGRRPQRARAAPQADEPAPAASPPRLRDLAPSCRGDLDVIVARAMAPTPDERYQSAAELAADLRRFVRHEPVAARGPDFWYRAAKFVRRRRSFAAMTSAVALSLATGAAVAGWQAVRAGEAARRGAKAMALAYSALTPGLQDESAGRGEFDALLRDIHETCEPEPLLHAEVSMTLGVALLKASDFRRQDATILLARSIELFDLELGGDDLRSIHAVRRAAAALQVDEGNPWGAELYDRAIASYRKQRDQWPGQYLDALRGAIATNLNLSRHTHALALAEESLAYQRSIGCDEASSLYDVHLLARALSSLGRVSEAIPRFEHVERVLAATGRDDALRCLNLHELAVTRASRLGDLTEWHRIVERAEALQAREAGCLSTAPTATLRRAGMLWARGDYVDAERLFRQILESEFVNVTWPGDVRGQARTGLALCLRDTGRWTDAEPLLRQELQSRCDRLGPEHWAVADARINLAKLLSCMGQHEEAADLAREALASRRAKAVVSGPDVVEAIAVSGLVSARAGDWGTAWPLLQQALDLRAEHHLESCWLADMAVEAMAAALRIMDRHDEAGRLLIDDHDGLVTLLGASNLATIRARNRVRAFHGLQGTDPVPEP